MVLAPFYSKVGSPSWADGIACPSLCGLDPIGEAETLLAKAERCMRKGALISTASVNEVFSLIQLAVDDRYFRIPQCFRGREREKYYVMYM